MNSVATTVWTITRASSTMRRRKPAGCQSTCPGVGRLRRVRPALQACRCRRRGPGHDELALPTAQQAREPALRPRLRHHRRPVQWGRRHDAKSWRSLHGEARSVAASVCAVGERPVAARSSDRRGCPGHSCFPPGTRWRSAIASRALLAAMPRTRAIRAVRFSSLSASRSRYSSHRSKRPRAVRQFGGSM